jgi:23S rRNA pseudouridine1911/1915/1917 synthase
MSTPSDRPPDDETMLSSGFLLPGGKVDAEAMHRALEAAGEDSDDEALRRVRFKLGRDLNKRLDKYLTDRITFMSRSQLQRLIDEGGVLVNGRVPKASTNLRLGDEVEVVVPPPPSSEIRPEQIPLEILFEDEHLLIINKAPDIIVHPARSHLSGTMINALAWHLRHASRSGGELSGVGKDFARPGVVHRLDRDTSGVIVFAKRDEAHWKLGHQFEHRTVEKRYLAVTHGRIEPATHEIDFPLGPHPSREKGYREKHVVRHDYLGKPALTIARVIEGYTGPVPASLVELELKTGRTHQIRVHLSHLGWPIIGDDMYGGKALGVTRSKHGHETLDVFPASSPPPGIEPIITRQALHAAMLAFDHPMTGQRLTFTAPLRGDMARLVHALRYGGVTRNQRDDLRVNLEAALGEATRPLA